ncbi:hypothetical protein ABIF24_003270 [Bradyrhizobium elkanii]
MEISATRRELWLVAGDRAVRHAPIEDVRQQRGVLPALGMDLAAVGRGQRIDIAEQDHALAFGPQPAAHEASDDLEPVDAGLGGRLDFVAVDRKAAQITVEDEIFLVAEIVVQRARHGLHRCCDLLHRHVGIGVAGKQPGS